MQRVRWWALILCAWFFSTPAPAWAISKLSSFDADYVHHLARFGDFLFVANAPAGGAEILSVDVSHPASPILLQRFSSPLLAGGSLDTNGTTLVAGGRSPNGIVLIDVSNPRAMNVRSTLPLLNSPDAIVVAGGLAYLATEKSGVKILDVSTMTMTPVPPPPLAVFESRHSIETVVPSVGSGSYALLDGPGLALDADGNAYQVQAFGQGFGQNQVIFKTTPWGTRSIFALPVSAGGAPATVRGIGFDLKGNMLLEIQLSDGTIPLVRVTGFTVALPPPPLRRIESKESAALIKKRL